MAEVGIGINMQENASTIAPRVTEALRDVSESADKLKQALDLGDLDQQYERFASRVEELQDKEWGEHARGGIRGTAGLPAVPRPTTDLVSQLGQRERQLAGGIQSAGGTLGRLGTSGDAMEAGGGILGSLGNILSSLGPAGTIIGGVALTAGAGVIAGNATIKQYERVMEESMGLAGAFGELKDTVEANSMTFRATTNSIAEMASEFGYKIEEGFAVMRGLAREGMGMHVGME
jgi:hypothetical protein